MASEVLPFLAEDWGCSQVCEHPCPFNFVP
jgi:hypothetical protein